MTASSMMTLRIDPQLLEALRRRAKHNGRSVSAEVVALVRRDLQPVKPGPRRKTWGMFAHLGEPPTAAEYRQFRRAMTAKIRRNVIRKVNQVP